MRQTSLALPPVLMTTLVNLTTWQKQLCATSIATFILAVSANFSIPSDPVPFTFQSIAVLMIGAMLGRKLGTLTLLQYLFIGAMGFPVFANGNSGLIALASPSSGYLYGFILSVYLAGFAAEKSYDKHLLSGTIAFACAHQMIFVCGVLYLSVYLHIGLIEAIKIGYLPFMGFDLLKIMFVTIIMLILWHYREKKQHFILSD